ncbi:DUF453 domain-containing protein [Pseudohyphozyma bogoriensis]|nr:DUF453 domain-containing protein [Pseudohyphozyma bogoriensis]
MLALSLRTGFRAPPHSLRHLSSSSIQMVQKKIPASYYRGGTSKAVMFLADDLPRDRKEWDPIFRSVMGSPDINGRQLDGMGGGLSSVSKIAVISKATSAEKDVDYEFVQVGVKDEVIDYASNCGNILSAVGPFALEKGLLENVPQGAGSVTARIFNTNTSKLVNSTFTASSSSEADLDGDFAIDGVPGTASRITLDFVNPGGAKTGKTLPSGNAVDTINADTVPGYDGPEAHATLVDVGNPCVFLRASDVGVDGDILPDILEGKRDVLAKIEKIRRAGAYLMGMVSSIDAVPLTVPKICLVSPRASYKMASGGQLEAGSIDIVARVVSSGDPHRACPITTGLCIAAAANVEGSVVHESIDGTAPPADSEGIVIGHPTGKLAVAATVTEKDGLVVAEKATIYRTARKLMEGNVFYKSS